MDIVKDDYVEGREYYGSTTRRTRGWVDSIRQDEENGVTYYNIQADDSYCGARATTLTSELGDVVKLFHKKRLLDVGDYVEFLEDTEGRKLSGEVIAVHFSQGTCIIKLNYSFVGYRVRKTELNVDRVTKLTPSEDGFGIAIGDYIGGILFREYNKKVVKEFVKGNVLHITAQDSDFYYTLDVDGEQEVVSTKDGVVYKIEN